MPTERKMPDWVYTGTRPKTDREYFENLSRCVFQAGLSWQLMANKWPGFRKAFDGFDIGKVAAYGAKDIKKLIEDPGIVRNRNKIVATIQNAVEFESIAREHGSFQRWLESIDRSNNHDKVVKSLRSRLKRVGPGTAHIFLWSVGEKIKYDPTVHFREPTKIV